ncbi:hypothetical protein BDP27DRAFT_1371491 [Rhodocollybia butyracea]|uniref:Uncharacterized protein n=1 Tax=Rhodocollybia butyracea TaxID=206335 RepID=A0A9P5P5V4_9AGAR|nr:hypothetical protein BDP27DRAFT_1371491 [Rhodocollybia butyracea]
MARRPTAILNQLIRRRRRRPVSAADGKGTLYALKLGTTPSGHWIVKFGMTINFPRQLREHERDCPTNNRVVLLTHKVAFRRHEGSAETDRDERSARPLFQAVENTTSFLCLGLAKFREFSMA